MPGLAALKSNYWGAMMAVSKSRMAMGGLAGGVYGATIGRDAGQSKLGGFMGGALGGAALGGMSHYGQFAYNRMGRMGGIRAAMAGARPGAFSSAMRATGAKMLHDSGRAFASMSMMAGSAGRYIGRSGLSSNEGFQKIRSLFR